MQASQQSSDIIEDAKNFEVALLIDDLSEAKNISDALREMGIYAHYYSELDEFWVAANAQTPDFLIIDVKKMSQGSTLFRNHPKVQNGSLAFCFYYSDSTKVLVNSTFQFNHFGLIKKELSLAGQLRCALRRRNEELRLSDRNDKLEERVDRLQRRSNRILKDAQDTFNFKNQFKALVDIGSRMGTAKSKQDYINQLMGVFGQWEACKSFGIYHLNNSDQKLVSPQAIKPGYESLPDLWLTRPAERGIDEYAQEMACEVAFDVFDNEARVLNIIGKRTHPEILLIGKFDEAALSDFPWEMLEEKLSYGMAKLLFAEFEQTPPSTTMTAWDSFSYMDDIHFHQARGNHKTADIDFSKLLTAISEKSGNRFYWKPFFSDFLSELEQTLSGDFKIAPYGAQSILVFIDKKFLEEDYQKLKAMVEDFQYWRYFQDTGMMMTQVMYPEVRVVAPSSVNYIRQAKTNLLAGERSISDEATRLGPTSFRRPTLDA